jgi:hypothetical protein
MRISLKAKEWLDSVHSSAPDTRVSKQHSNDYFGLSPAKALPHRSIFLKWYLIRNFDKYVIFHVLVMLITLAPFLIFDMPGISDYPNHLARMHLLVDWPDHPASKFFDVVWFLTPNLAMDIIVPAFGQILGVEAATRAFLVISMMLIMTGAAAIEVAVKKRISPVSLIAPLFSYNTAFIFGFLNFIFSFGLALWAIALWITLRNSRFPVRALPHAIFVPILFVCHLHGLAIYLAAVGAYEMWYLISRRPRLTDTLATFSLLAGALLLAYVGLVLGDDRPAHGGILWGYSLKARFLATFAGGYGTGIASLKVLAVMILVLWAWWRNALRVHPAAIWIAGALVTVFLVMPYGIMGSYFADVRFLVAALFIVPAFITWHETSGPAGKFAAAFYATVLLCNVANVTWAWAYLQQDYREIRQSFALLEPQRKILIARPQSGNRFTWVQRALIHAPTLAVADRGAFSPLLFTYPGSQIVRPRPEYSRIDISEGLPVAISDLMMSLVGPPSLDNTDEAYWKTWTMDFDYLYLMYPTEGWTNPLPEILTPISSGREFVLYRIHNTCLKCDISP